MSGGVMGSFSIWHWLVVLLLVVLVFGTKKLKGVGTDLGEAVKGFKKGVREGEPEQTSTDDASVKRIGGADAQSAPSGSRQHPPPA